MSLRNQIQGYLPRKAEGLPPGQREVSAFPRFSDEPLRWAPPTTPRKLVIAIEGSDVVTFDEDWWSAQTPVEITSDFHCVTTWTYRNVNWSGLPLIDLVAHVMGDDVLATLPQFAAAYGADDRHAVSLTKDILDPSVLVATHLEGEPLSRRHGAPLRLVSPYQYGYKSAKHLIRVDFCAERSAGSFGAKEHLRARVALEERHSRLPPALVRIPYRLTIIPTALAADRGLENSPKD